MKKVVNKESMREFCNHLHDGKTYTPLCKKINIKESDGGYLCCALGEMHHYFTGKIPYNHAVIKFLPKDEPWMRGCECWWGGEETSREKISSMEIIEIDIDDSRKEANGS